VGEVAPAPQVLNHVLAPDDNNGISVAGKNLPFPCEGMQNSSTEASASAKYDDDDDDLLLALREVAFIFACARSPITI
jgi:hypothetical protein